MKLYLSSAALVLLAACNQSTPKTTDALTYPNARKVDTVTNYFGTKVADPYRWLENDTSAETAQWKADGAQKEAWNIC